MSTVNHQIAPMFVPYIPEDGYTEQGFIQAIPGLCDVPVRFKFRPMLPEERAEHADELSRLQDGAAKQLCLNTLVAERLQSWDVMAYKRDGDKMVAEPVAICPVAVGRLKEMINGRLYGIVTGIEPSDIDPDWEATVKQREIANVYESAKFKKLPGDKKQEKAEGN